MERMLLDDLVQLIERLRERIQQHGPALAQSEMLTRYALIDPLLRALGWDTEDPEIVVPEYNSGAGRPDYALMAGDQPKAMVEAKALNGDITAGGVTQVINYCIQKGTPYFAVTDGRRWQLYDMYKQGGIDQKKVLSFDITQGSVPELVVQTLALWRKHFAPAESVPTLGPQPTPVRVRPSVPVLTPSPSSLPSAEPGWIRLTDLRAEHQPTRPKSLRLPDESQRPLRSWANLLKEIAEWLSKCGKLNKSVCPIPMPGNRATRYLVDTQPKHPSGKEFVNPVHVGGAYWLEANANARQQIEAVRYLVSRLGDNPSDFAVIF